MELSVRVCHGVKGEVVHVLAYESGVQVSHCFILQLCLFSVVIVGTFTITHIFSLAYESGIQVSHCFILQLCLFSVVIVGTFTVLPKYKYFSPADFTLDICLNNLCHSRTGTDNNNSNMLPLSVNAENIPDCELEIESKQNFDPYELTRSREALSAINHVPSLSIPSLYTLRRLHTKHNSMSLLYTAKNSPIVRQTSSVDDLATRNPVETRVLLNQEQHPDTRKSESEISHSESGFDEVDCGITRNSRRFNSEMTNGKQSFDECSDGLTKPNERRERTTFIDFLISPLYMWVVVWLCLNRLRSWFFISVFNPWLSNMAVNCGQVSFYTSIFATMQFFGITTAPISGRLMDRKSAVKYSSVKYERMHTSILTLSITCTISLALSIMSTIPVIEAQIVTFILHCAHRSFVYGPNTAFIANAFPFEHFGKLVGTSLTISALFSLIQYALIVVIQGPLNGDPLVVNIVLIVCSLFSFVLPLYIRRYLRGKARTAPVGDDHMPLHEQ